MEAMKTLPRSLHIGVIRGGASPEYETSLKVGAHLLENLSDSHKPYDIFLAQDGTWHINGVARTPERILKHVDVVFNSVYGPYGESGQLQNLLSSHGVKYVGSPKWESSLAASKIAAKERLKKFGVKTPVYVVVRRTDSLAEKAKEIWSSIPHPLMVKPANVGSKKDFYKVDSFPKLLDSLEKCLATYDTVLAEEFIAGKDVSVLVTQDFRGQLYYAFPPTGLLSRAETSEVEDLAKGIHYVLNLRDYSASDFVVSPKRGIYFLAVSTTPKIGKESRLHQSIESVGVKVKDFLHHLVDLALNRKG
jgi:D-alanine-D-alanine ligase-like ATP-grasp enzyme